MSRFQLFLGAWSLSFALAAFYIVWGSFNDVAKRVVARRRRRVLEVLSVVLFESDEDAERIHERAMEMPRRELLAVVQSLAVDLNGQARDRLQHLVRALGLERFIRRRARSRRWRMRVQAAQLQYLVEHPDFDRRRLLTDKHHIVRARAAESLTAQQAAEHVDELVDLLRDDSVAVRLAVQQKLLEVGSAAVPVLLDELYGERHVLEALEVAANLADPRLVEALVGHARSEDPVVRATAARALGSGSGPGAGEMLEVLCGDDDPEVRVAAIEGLARMESQASVAIIGRLLGDRSWQVRRAAGLALDRLGPPGSLILRSHLDDLDPFARDMARQVLDAAAARDGVTLIPPIEDPLRDIEALVRAAEEAGETLDDLDAQLPEPDQAPERDLDPGDAAFDDGAPDDQAPDDSAPDRERRSSVRFGVAPARPRAATTGTTLTLELDDAALEALLGPAVAPRAEPTMVELLSGEPAAEVEAAVEQDGPVQQDSENDQGDDDDEGLDDEGETQR